MCDKSNLFVTFDISTTFRISQMRVVVPCEVRFETYLLQILPITAPKGQQRIYTHFEKVDGNPIILLDGEVRGFIFNNTFNNVIPRVINFYWFDFMFINICKDINIIGLTLERVGFLYCLVCTVEYSFVFLFSENKEEHTPMSCRALTKNG